MDFETFYSLYSRLSWRRKMEVKLWMLLMTSKKARILVTLLVILLSAWVVWLAERSLAGPILLLVGALITYIAIEAARFRR